MAAAGDDRRYGGFVLGSMQLALPVAVLREVVPCGQLATLPCTTDYVVGGIDLRGVTIPVVDLGRLFGHDRAPAGHPCVVVIADHGRLLGLLADGVTGIFASGGAGLNRAGADDPDSAVFAGSITRADDGALLSVLSPQAIARLDGVVPVDDPDAAQPAAGSASHGAAARDEFPVLLMRCARHWFAIDALAVHTTLARPRLEDSALAMGDCRGVTALAGRSIAAVDLLGLSGLGRTGDSPDHQAVVLRIGRGMVALLVDQVVDIILADHADVVAVPGFALPQPALFAGALAMPAGARQDGAAAGDQVLVLDPAGLAASPVLGALAQATVPAGAAAMPDAGEAALPDAGSAVVGAMITFELFAENATPIEQIAEIVPFEPALAARAARGALLGIQMNRGRSIAVLCLRRLAGLPAVALPPEASVLVVQAGEDWIGFAVPRLRTIETAHWTPELPRHGRPDADPLAAAIAPRKLAWVGSGAGRRMLRVLELAHIADCVRVQGPCA